MADPDQVHRVLAADAAVEIWNYPDDVLREAAGRWRSARRGATLRAWLAARLRPTPPDELWQQEFHGVEPEWPRAVPFPIADPGAATGDRAAGALAFVGAGPRTPLPPAPPDPAALPGLRPT